MKVETTLIIKLFVCVILFTGCSKSEIPTYQGVSAVNFGKIENADYVVYSFLGNTGNDYIQEIPVIIMGDTSARDRTFNVEVVNDSNTTANPNQYEIIGGTVKKGEVKGTLAVRLIKTPSLDTSTVSLKLRLKNSEDFNVGNVETSDFIIKWTNKIVVPSWSYFRYFFTSAGSTAAFRIIVETTGLTTLTARQYGALGEAAVIAYATKFGDYIKQWNKDNPDNKLKHDDGTKAGQEIVPLYYTHSKFD